MIRTNHTTKSQTPAPVRLNHQATDGFNLIVQSYSQILFATVAHITKNKQTSEDIVQETFLRLWEKRIELTGENIGGWLYRVACNLAYRHQRRELMKARIYADLQVSDSSSFNNVEDILQQKEHTQNITAVYNRLPEKQQAVYLLSHKEGLSRQEIASHLNISPNTVRNHLARAVQFLKDNTRCACIFVFSIFTLLNQIILFSGSTKQPPGDLYKVGPPTEKNKITEMNKRRSDINTFLLVAFPQ